MSMREKIEQIFNDYDPEQQEPKLRADILSVVDQRAVSVELLAAIKREVKAADDGRCSSKHALMTIDLLIDNAHVVFAEAKPSAEPSRCKCSMRTKLVGDGCSVCNPYLHSAESGPLTDIHGVIAREAKPSAEMPTGCHRSHPHELMSPECEAKVEPARLANLEAQHKPANSRQELADESQRLGADPLQGAVDWLLAAFETPISIGEIQQRLVIGYNRANRLRIAALTKQEKQS